MHAGSGLSRLNVVRAGCQQGELEIEYDSGEVVYGRLMGMGSELDISLSTNAVSLLPAYVHKQSQSMCRQVFLKPAPIEHRGWQPAACLCPETV